MRRLIPAFRCGDTGLHGKGKLKWRVLRHVRRSDPGHGSRLTGVNHLFSMMSDSEDEDAPAFLCSLGALVTDPLQGVLFKHSASCASGCVRPQPAGSLDRVFPRYMANSRMALLPKIFSLSSSEMPSSSRTIRTVPSFQVPDGSLCG